MTTPSSRRIATAVAALLVGAGIVAAQARTGGACEDDAAGTAVEQVEASSQANLDDADLSRDPTGTDVAPSNFAQSDVHPDDVAAPAAVASRQLPATCTYSTYAWSSAEGRATNRARIEKAYAEVTDDERSPDDPRCSVCEEDQVAVTTPALEADGVGTISVCWAHAERIEAALREIGESGQFRFVDAVGYRPGRTRGAIVDGVRTEWSNHAFGTAVDINAAHNGLYRSCNVDPVDEAAISGCSLGVGGAWRPSRSPDVSIVRGGVVYEAMVETAGWRWGGDIAGSTRDLMHFSLTGY